MLEVGQATLDSLLNHLHPLDKRAAVTTEGLAVLERDDEFVAAVVAKLERILVVLEVPDLDVGDASVQPDQAGGLLAIHADALDRASTTVFGTSKAKVGGLDFEEAGNGVHSIHSVLVFFVESEVEVVATGRGKLSSLVPVIGISSAIIAITVAATGPVGRSSVAAIIVPAVVDPLSGGCGDDAVGVGRGLEAGTKNAANILLKVSERFPCIFLYSRDWGGIPGG